MHVELKKQGILIFDTFAHRLSPSATAVSAMLVAAGVAAVPGAMSLPRRRLMAHAMEDARGVGGLVVCQQ